jgi:hypothetical protein
VCRECQSGSSGRQADNPGRPAVAVLRFLDSPALDKPFRIFMNTFNGIECGITRNNNNSVSFQTKMRMKSEFEEKSNIQLPFRNSLTDGGRE